MKRLNTYSRKKDGDSAPRRPLSPPPKAKNKGGGLLSFFRRAEAPPSDGQVGHVEEERGTHGRGGAGDNADDNDVEDDDVEEMMPPVDPKRKMWDQDEEDDGEDLDEECEQMYLTDGSEKCRICRMRYSRGVAEDEALHARHCKRFKVGVKWPQKAVADVLQSLSDGSHIIYTNKMCSALKDAVEVVDTELGFADDEDGAPGEHLPTGFYMFLSDKRHVVGMVIVVPIERGFRIVTTPAHDETEHGPAHFVCSKDVEKASVGISRIWVHQNHRRKKIGLRLLDAVQSHVRVEKHLFAFSQPTMMGAALARVWFGRSDFLLMKD